MAVWPASLPQTPLLGATAALPDLLVRSQMEVGPAKVRRRQTAAAVPQDVPIQLTDAQRTTLEGFFVTTLNGGAEVFDYVDITTGLTASFRFRSPPVLRVLAPGWWTAVLPLEVMP